MKLAKCVASPEPIFCTVTTTANGHVSMDVLRTHLVHPCANRIWNGRLDLPANATPKPAWTGARCASCAQVKRPHSAWNRFTRRKNMLGVGTRLSPRDLGYPSSSELTDELGGAAVTKTEKDGDNLPSMADIVAAAEEKGVKLELKGWGPFFSVQALSLAGKTLGRAEGFILQWFQEKILHLDWIRLTKESGQSRTSTLGVGLFIGAVAVRHGFDCSCTKAELLAINDSPEFHNKVRKMSATQPNSITSSS